MTTTTICRAWAIQRRDSVVLGFTDHDARLEFDGILFRPDHGMSARALVQGSGLSVDNSEAAGALSDDAITERDLLAGLWDGATLRMWEVDWNDPRERTLIFAGSLGEVSRGNGAFRAELRGLSEPLNAAQGRVYHPRCSARLGDGCCKLDLTDDRWRETVAVEGLDEGRILRFASFGNFTNGWFERGSLLVLDGPAKGLGGVVKNDISLSGGGREIELWQAMAILPRVGDRLRLTTGCDKRADTCQKKFANFLNFRGFPHLPSEDWLMAPGAEGRNG
ncbi:DUF2163 domain-containing protein [Paracoccus sp. R12_1]|uniref:DUF2163 domain-containing protein n=1 Tax=unclassified Paracoccus (in: a-proteobacteria) TaxID=2688777 RepID=UPI001AD96799|nr:MULTISPECIES: DUF2163 domain-containing protein [unclassified Paracoccus (in: a-proteobacteria)]MBO9455903.1 DUF2163 domain-containing protein [Paracoccus sp. R12_2]MBO9486681.1 DUF2163 domain-containing protein [Paracoccus sp. R12_1]